MDRVVWSVKSLVLMTVALQLVAVTVAAPAGSLIPSLPGQPVVSFNQYGGYVTVDQSHGRNLYYYFVEAANSPATAPLILWLNGGPGCSSLTGAFAELGPFRPNTAGDGLIVNSYSWNNVANVIFLESPAGVGFSYSNNISDYNTDDVQTAQDSLVFLLEWFVEYPEYSSNDFYITGESYAGHYVPQLATAVLKNNNVPGQPQIRLKGIKVGNPLFDPVIDGEYSPLEYAWGHGMFDQDTHDIIVAECNFTSASRTSACLAAETIAFNEAAARSAGRSYIDPYDVLEDVCLTSGQQAIRLQALYRGLDVTLDPCSDDEMTTYLNRGDVQSALHANATQWQYCSNGSLNYNESNAFIYIAPVLADLVNSNLRVWIYSGDADIVIPFIGTRLIINTLSKTLNLTTNTTYQAWFQGSQVGGWTVSWGSLVYSTVRGAGHMVPATQPARSLQLFTSFLAGEATPPLTPVGNGTVT